MGEVGTGVGGEGGGCRSGGGVREVAAGVKGEVYSCHLSYTPHSVNTLHCTIAAAAICLNQPRRSGSRW